MHLLDAAVLTALCLPAAAPAHAQTRDYAALHSSTGYSAPEQRVAVGITLPIGRSRDTAQRAPRIEFRIDRNRVDASGDRLTGDDGHSGSVRIGRSIAGPPQWLLNDRPIASTDGRNGISTLGGVAIGVGAVLIIGVIVTATTPLEIGPPVQR